MNHTTKSQGELLNQHEHIHPSSIIKVSPHLSGFSARVVLFTLANNIPLADFITIRDEFEPFVKHLSYNEGNVVISELFRGGHECMVRLTAAVMQVHLFF